MVGAVGGFPIYTINSLEIVNEQWEIKYVTINI